MSDADANVEQPKREGIPCAFADLQFAYAVDSKGRAGNNKHCKKARFSDRFAETVDMLRQARLLRFRFAIVIDRFATSLFAES